MNPVRVGVIGIGNMGWHHARVLSLLRDAELVGVADPDEARGRLAVEQFDCRWFADFQEMLAEVEAVCIAVPTLLHHRVGMACLESGVDVLIEKPIAATKEEAADLIGAADAAGRLLQVGHIERFNPAFRELLKVVKDEEIVVLEARRHSPNPDRANDVSVVLDLMIHDIGIVLALVKSPIAKIDSVGVTVLSKSEDIANARIEFANGCVANLSASRMSVKKAREIRIFQSDAYLSLDFMNQAGHLVKKSDIVAYAVKMKIGLVKPGDASAVPVREIPIEKGEPLALELAHFVESVAKAKQPKVGAALGKSALEVAIAITEQIRKGQR